MKPFIIIPTYNEKENIKVVVEAVLALNLDAEIVIIDDDSPDGTGKIADEVALRHSSVKVIHRPGKLGLGSAYIEGFKYALKNSKADFIFEMDADFSHDPSAIPKFIEAVKDADVVVGSRYIRGVNVINWPMSRLLLSYISNIYARSLTGVPVKDLTSGFKCYRRGVLESIDLDSIKSDGYAFQIETLFLCHRKGFRVREIPIIFTERLDGSSKMTKAIVREAFFMVLYLAASRFFIRRNKV